MDDIRNAIVSKLDSLISRMLENSDGCNDAHLQIEACIFYDQQKTGCKQPTKRVILNTINLGDFRAHRRRIPPAQESDKPQSLPEPLRLPTTIEYYDRANCEEQSNCDIGETIVVRPEPDAIDQCSAPPSSAPRKEVGGLRLGHSGPGGAVDTPPRTPTPPTTRQLETDERQFPKRRKLDRDGPAKLERSTVDKLIEGIWEQIHRSRSLALGRELGEMFTTVTKRLTDGVAGRPYRIDFEDASRCCQQITSGSRTSRALEVIVQAYWIGCHDARIVALGEERPDLKTYEVKKAVLTEACRFFQWSEKELRNRMAIWKGYKEIKDVAGWAALVFAGPGIYRFCKYRMGFDQDALAKLQSMGTRFEVAADTLQPRWRELLSLVGEPTQLHWRGHPHDWVVSKKKIPVPLSFTYRHLDTRFTYQHVEESILDTDQWNNDNDPRRTSQGPDFVCHTCSGKQSINVGQNECECFPDLFGPNPSTPAPVQVFRTDNGKLNGLIACCSFARGQAVGEFVGLITKNVVGVDVMQSQAAHNEPYQIWQGRCGNFTRFLNHSCLPNCQFQIFSWLGIQRILVVSKGVLAGKELTVDYSGRYWQGLNKECLCGETRCRYKSRPHQS